MKSKITFTLFLFAMVLFACKKENDIGIQIDGNGKPASVANGSLTTSNAGTCIDSNGKPMGKDTATSDYGIAIDPDGKPRP